jgi:hypothetical protein
MSRAWPFESTPEGRPVPGRVNTIEQFVGGREDRIEAVVVRIGLNDAQLVLVDDAGAWDRWVFHSIQEATEAATDKGIKVHTGGFPEELRVRMNAHRRPPEDFEAGAYPEQGRVGPVIPYPENRPRRIDHRVPPEEPGHRP